jgi:Zn-dependent protease
MKRSYSLGRIAGIPIELDPSWFLVLGMVTWTLSRGYFPSQLQGIAWWRYWMMGLLSASLLFTCVLLHELGHSLVAKWAGIPVLRVRLFLFGGVAQIGGHPHTPWIEFLVALAGPLVSIVLAGLCAWLSQQMRAATLASAMSLVILRYLAVVNMALLLFNLLPGFPLDGGRALRAVLWAWFKDVVRATKIVTLLGQGLGLALMGLGILTVIRGQWLGGAWYVLLGVFLRDAAAASYQDLVMRQTLTETLVRPSPH